MSHLEELCAGDAEVDSGYSQSAFDLVGVIAFVAGEAQSNHFFQRPPAVHGIVKPAIQIVVVQRIEPAQHLYASGLQVALQIADRSAFLRTYVDAIDEMNDEPRHAQGVDQQADTR